MDRRIIILSGACVLALFFFLALTTQGFRLVGRTGVHTEAAAAFGLDKTSLYAWYDFTSDESDAHGTNDLGVTGSPIYTNLGGQAYAICTSNTPAGFVDDAGANIGTSWNTNDVDSALVCRWRVRTGFVNGHRVASFKNQRAQIRYLTSNINGRMGNKFDTSGTAGNTNDWFCTVVNHEVGNIVETFINNSTDGKSTGTYDVANNLLGYLPGEGITHQDADIDYIAFYNRILTTAEVAAVYNSSNTITYADLDD